MVLKIQEILTDLVHILLSLVKVLLLSKFKIRFPEAKSKEIFILGNGPSLNSTLHDSFEKLRTGILFCVNGFIYSDYYEKLKPSNYILNAPEYFMETPPTQMHIEMREKIFDMLVNKTTWEIKLFVPVLASQTTFWLDRISKNKNIRTYFYNTAPVEGPKWFTDFFFTHNLGMPRPHNVLVPAIFLSLNMNYKKLIIFGADHSWIEETRVDNNNELTVNHEHFYDSTKVIAPMYKLQGQKYFFHDALRKWYLAFKGYFILKKYADFKHATILNATKKSYIDAFEKIKF